MYNIMQDNNLFFELPIEDSLFLSGQEKDHECIINNNKNNYNISVVGQFR